MASHATTKEESPTIVERFRNNVFAYVTGTQVSNNLDVPRPGLCGPRPGLHEAVCRIICSRRHETSRKRRSGSECASAPRKRDASRMFLFDWRRTESAGSSTPGGKEPFPGLGSHSQTELQPGDIDASPARLTRCKLMPAELEMAEISVRGMADIPLVDVQADPAEATAVSSGNVTALAASLGGHGQTELQPGDIESPPAKPTLAELDTAEIPAFEAGREVADIPPVGVQADPAEAMAIS